MQKEGLKLWVRQKWERGTEWQRGDRREEREDRRREGGKKGTMGGRDIGRRSERAKTRATNRKDALWMPFLSSLYLKGSCFRECDLDYQGRAGCQTMTSTFFKPSKWTKLFGCFQHWPFQDKACSIYLADSGWTKESSPEETTKKLSCMWGGRNVHKMAPNLISEL